MGSSIDPTAELPWSLSDPDKLEFAELRSTGRVHVAMPPVERAAWWKRYRARGINAELWPSENADALSLIFNPIPCMCGLLITRPAGGYVDEFADETLCRTCHRAWVASGRDVALLFEHDQPGAAPDLDDIGGVR